ncbi:signal peptidase I [Terrabacter sp. NPDC000476]|uniref:signal peptidase I n=1 Tax=Terrabacter sp. NPDC000476 TaxID=3154258 RepID=UPI00332A3A6F
MTATTFAPRLEAVLGASAHPGAALEADVDADLGVGAAAGVGALRRAAQVAATGLAVVAAAVFLLLAVGPHVLGYRTATMLTGSMSPGINPGDVVVTVPRAAADVQVGDVITYEIPVEDHRVETHRIVRVTTDAAGRRAVVTKGDANSDVDPWVATLDQDTVWEVATVVPHVGNAIRAVRSGLGQGWVLWGALGGFVLLTLRSIWSASGTEEDERGVATGYTGRHRA